jgi:hypothetical protein
MPDLIATIFHVTDMHLSVETEGDVRKMLPSARLLVKLA